MKNGYVIDANVLFSAFMSGRDVYHLLSSEHTIYVPDFAFMEIEKYKQLILNRTKLKKKNLQKFVLKLLSNVTVIPTLLISQDSLKQAYHLCKGLDEKDTVYVAVSIEFGLKLITNDKILYNGLRERKFNKVILLGGIINTLSTT